MKQIKEIIIKPRKGYVPINLKELWQFHELLYFLSWRDIKVKYKQSLFGIGWVILRPLVTMAIFSVLFGRIGKFPSEGVPYPIFVFLGLLPWTYFSTSLTAATKSLVGGANLIRKVYFPRILLPLSVGISNLLDLFVSMSLLLILMKYYQIIPHTGILLAPLFIFAIFITALGPGMLFGALNARYRDIGHIIPFVVQTLMFLTPIIYPVSFIPEKYQILIYLNPLAGPIEAFRASILGHMELNKIGLSISLMVGIIIFAVGLFYFKRVESTLADII